MTDAANSEENKRLLVEVKGFLELVNTVDEEGNRTNETPLLAKLINAPPPMTPSEAAQIRDEAENARKAKQLAEEEKDQTEKSCKEKEAEAAAKLAEIAAKEKELEEKNKEVETAIANAKAEAQKEKETAVKAQEKAKASLEKAEKEFNINLERLKSELVRTQTANEANVKKAVQETQKSLEIEKKAAEELMSLAQEQTRTMTDQIAKLQEEVDALKQENQAKEQKLAEKASHAAASSPQSFFRPPSPAEPPVGDLGPSAESIGEIEQMIREHNSWKSEFERLSGADRDPRAVAQPAMPDDVDPSLVIEHVLDLSGNEIFPPKEHFVKTQEDDILYRHAMRADDNQVRERILTKLGEKRRAMLDSQREITSRQPYHSPAEYNAQYAPSRGAALAPRAPLSWNPQSLPSYASPRGSAMNPIPPSNLRFAPVPPARGGWFCCKSSLCCPDGMCCPDCASPGQMH